MTLWIRSQENEKLRPMLLKVNEFEIGDYDDDMNCIVVNNLHCVGIYKSKERALEVLDEIQDLLIPIQEYIHKTDMLEINYKNIDTIVYEMPKD